MQSLSITRLREFITLSRSFYDWKIVLAEWDIKYEDKGTTLSLTCPFHADRRPSFGINLAQGTYHCFSCGRKGTAVRFMHEMSGTSQPFAQYCQQLLTASGEMQRLLGFNSMYMTEKTLAPELCKRITFNKGIHLGSDMPITVLADKLKATGNSWEVLALSLGLLQAGVPASQTYDTICGTTSLVTAEFETLTESAQVDLSDLLIH